MKYSKLKNEIKSPLRYPGGKTRLVQKILPKIPRFKEYREPFLGGGSVFVAVRQRTKRNKKKFRVADLNENLYLFWKCAQKRNGELIKKVHDLKHRFTDGRKLYDFLSETEMKNDIDRATKFFVMNRICFSGLAESGGYSAHAFRYRFTESSISRIRKLMYILKDVAIEHADYEDVVMAGGDGVFIFLDPPYYKSRDKRLYGKDGSLHSSFDHERFAAVMQRCSHKWFVTYDDSEKIRDLFDFAHISEWEVQYGMNNYGSDTADAGNELFISNYDIDDIVGDYASIDYFF